MKVTVSRPVEVEVKNIRISLTRYDLRITALNGDGEAVGQVRSPITDWYQESNYEARGIQAELTVNADSGEAFSFAVPGIQWLREKLNGKE